MCVWTIQQQNNKKKHLIGKLFLRPLRVESQAETTQDVHHSARICIHVHHVSQHFKISSYRFMLSSTLSCLHPPAVVHGIGSWVGTEATDLFQGLLVGLEWVHSLLDWHSKLLLFSVSFYPTTFWVGCSHGKRLFQWTGRMWCQWMCTIKLFGYFWLIWHTRFPQQALKDWEWKNFPGEKDTTSCSKILPKTLCVCLHHSGTLSCECHMGGQGRIQGGGMGGPCPPPSGLNKR